MLWRTSLRLNQQNHRIYYEFRARSICKELGKNLPFTRLDELAHNALVKGLIDKDEAAILVKAEESRLRSINVDDFDPEELATKPVKLPEKVRKVEAA